jgi:tight adherence protein B
VIILLILFLLSFGVVVGCVSLAFSYFKSKQKQQIRSMLRKAEATPAEQRSAQLMRPAETEDFISRLLTKFEFTERLNLILDQAGTTWTGSKLVIISAVFGGIGFLIGLKVAIPSRQVSSLVLGALASLLPMLYVLRKRSKTMSEFEEQFPEALDFLSRSMRAGHGFSVALEMLAVDSPEPLGRAFRRISNDLALGSSLETSLKKMILLFPLVDVRFFVSSVILQQETGGNLGEILSKLSYIIRERFRLKGQVKAVSAHGRITGLVLLLMPLGVTGFIMMSNPRYLTGMYADSTGRMMIYGVIAGQFVGYFVIKKIINIKV